MSENHLRSALGRGEFVCSAELVLGRDHATDQAERFVCDAAAGGPVRVISVTDLPGGNPALPPDAFVSTIVEHGLTPIAHLTGKDANRALIEGRLHAFARAGVESILALTGDVQRDGWAGAGKPVHDLDSVLILRLIEELRAGLEHEVGQRQVTTTPFDFFPGVVVNPFKPREPDLMMQLYKLELKIAAGARFIITQLGFNLRKLYELRQYLVREGLGHIPVLANVYVPTPAIGRMMQSGELAGCVATDDLVRRLEAEKKPERLERAALLVAAVKELGFAGAHIGGFGMAYGDFLTILERAAAIGSSWRERMDELVFPYPDEFYLLPVGQDGLSDPAGEYQFGRVKPRSSLTLRVSRLAHRHIISSKSLVGQTFGKRLKPALAKATHGEWRQGFIPLLLKPSSFYRHSFLGCVDCGDCIQDHLLYAGCSMGYCYKELRNGPCGGSTADGKCEAHPAFPCLWTLVYQNALAAGEDPRRFASTLIPPRDWTLDDTNALVNHYAEIDNAPRRVTLPDPRVPPVRKDS